jgi:hypothetical protein
MEDGWIATESSTLYGKVTKLALRSRSNNIPRFLSAKVAILVFHE